MEYDSSRLTPYSTRFPLILTWRVGGALYVTSSKSDDITNEGASPYTIPWQRVSPISCTAAAEVARRLAGMSEPETSWDQVTRRLVAVEMGRREEGEATPSTGRS